VYVTKDKTRKSVEWPTLALIIVTTCLWFVAVFWLAGVSLWLAVPATAWIIAQHASLQHEVIHGHPFRNPRLNAALVWPAFSLVIPFARFRDSHLAHHNDETLTDPYDDPETHYLDQAVFQNLPPMAQWVLRCNNTLAGRLLIGPLVSTGLWIFNDMRSCEKSAVMGWLWHIPPIVAVLWLVIVSPMPVWAYLLAAYGSLSLIKIRTFLEHQAHVRASGRTVIVEARGPFALLFLNNNLHVVHHMHPQVPWYDLPDLYRQHRAHYQRRNGGYVYRSYLDVFRRHFWRAKDPVAHPLWQPKR
jgi:fatty acid desaturase